MSDLQSLHADIKKFKSGNDVRSLEKLSKTISQMSSSSLESQGYINKKIAILGGYNTSFLAKLLPTLLFDYKIRAEIFEGDYGTLESLIFARDEHLSQFAPDICYFCVGAEHVKEAAPWRQLWKQTHEFLKCEIIQNTLEEPTLRALSAFERRYAKSDSNVIASLNQDLLDDAPGFVHFLDVNYLASCAGKLKWRDDRLYDISKIPVAYDHYVDYGSELASLIGAIYGKTKKCLVLDLDNTLWGGVIGDDGLSGIAIGQGSAAGESHLRFQKYIRSLKERGVILAVCSKNNEDIAKEAFAKRPEMALSLDDFSVFVANWEPKSQNIVKIAQELNIGLDALVFVDDNPAERAQVQSVLPEVAVLDMPEDPADYAAALNRANYFNITSLTNEDLQRTEQYKSNKSRTELLNRTANYDEYLKSLEMQALIASFDDLHRPRITQLINKTNQFNLTTRRYNESQILEIMASQNALTRYIILKDKFGDNGLISVLIAFEENETLRIDTWLMSCRVLKRGVELFLMKNVLAAAKEKGLGRIRGEYLPTAKNGLVKNLFHDFGFEQVNDTIWELDIASNAAQTILEKPVFINAQ